MVVRAGGAGSDNELAAGLPVALSLTLGYGLVHASIRYLSSGNLGEDDPPAVIDAPLATGPTIRRSTNGCYSYCSACSVSMCCHTSC